LTVADTHDAGCPLRDSRRPLLACDLWEHAYYLDRGSDRAGYVDGFWALVDWRRVATRLQAAQAGARTAVAPRLGDEHRTP
jgi:Fe-Mn family superoxide dismutase